MLPSKQNQPKTSETALSELKVMENYSTEERSSHAISDVYNTISCISFKFEIRKQTHETASYYCSQFFSVLFSLTLAKEFQIKESFFPQCFVCLFVVQQMYSPTVLSKDSTFSSSVVLKLPP